ncbi:hypothetical protein HY418_02220 [Candidatus Kaiserbacteria bacterium]|nr:hypothetical protein [Candidatus Kaiserbacteria bacterium]
MEYGVWSIEGKAREQRGITTLLAVGFIGVLTIVIGTIASYTFQQSKYGRALFAREQALNIAEAGLEYYKWFLARTPTAVQTGVGLVSPYTYTVSDPEGGTLGSAEVTAASAMQCGKVQWIDLVSKGTANANVGLPRTVAVRYMRPSTAEYSYIVGTDVWAGSNRTIRGPYHSNGGIRMDATHNADVISGVSTWNCTSSYGCNPSQPSAPGVVGTGSNPALWTVGAPPISFPGIAVDFTDLKTKAQTQGGIYYGALNGNVNNRGYHLIFNAAGTVTIYRVTQTTGYDSYSTQYGYTEEYSDIDNQTLLGTFAIPSSCSLMFFEDRVWVEGTVNGKVTVIAATPSDGGTSPDVYLNNNIYYNAYDGTDGLTVVAERNVLIPLIVPDVMEIHGIFIAQSGHYGRDYFWTTPYNTRSQLTTVGTVVSNGRTGTSWSDGTGFVTRLDYYDQQLAFAPPPFTPVASTDYKFALWREQ